MQPGSEIVERFVALPEPRHVTGLLPAIAAQADAADASRTVDPAVIAALKASNVLALSATKEIGGLEESIGQIAAELCAVAAACSSTAWCLWNHLCVFHLFVGSLGPDHTALLRSIVEGHEWVCFPGGGGSRLLGVPDGDDAVLNGPTMFGSGCRYADWTGLAFALTDGVSAPTADSLRFSIARIDSPGVRIEATWDGGGLRASATDTVHHEGTRVPLDRCVPWYAANRAVILRDPAVPMIAHRYREDWVGLSDLWLAWMAIGVVAGALDEAVGSIGGGRKAIMGASMANLPMVQANLGEVAALVTAARSMMERACAEVDERIDGEVLPTEADYQRQGSTSAVALRLCEEAMGLLLRTLGGNGLRESGSFERRWRDLHAMPIHINAHVDRVYPRLGQLLLDVPMNRF